MLGASLSSESFACAVARATGLLGRSASDLLLLAVGLAVLHRGDGLVGLLLGRHINHLLRGLESDNLSKASRPPLPIAKEGRPGHLALRETRDDRLCEPLLRPVLGVGGGSVLSLFRAHTGVFVRKHASRELPFRGRNGYFRTNSWVHSLEPMIAPKGHPLAGRMSLRDEGVPEVCWQHGPAGPLECHKHYRLGSV